MHGPISRPLAEWYGLFVLPNAEFRVLAALERLGIAAYMPIMTMVRRDHRGHMVERRLPLFTRYMFINCPTWDLSRIVEVPDVVGLLPPGRMPIAISAIEIASLQSRELANEFYFRNTVTGRKKARRLLRSLKELGPLWETLAAAA